MKHCSVDECIKKYYAHGLCRLHYDRMHTQGRLYTIKINRGGMSKHPLHNTYMNMLERCNNPKNTNFNNYGAKGVRVCSRWDGEYGFTFFLEDMGNKPDGYTLDRIDVTGDYTPENCRWASRTVQAINTRIRKDNKTGHVGVWYHEKSSRYHSYIKTNGKRKRLGCFKNLQDAIDARKNAEDEYYKPLIGAIS